MTKQETIDSIITVIEYHAQQMRALAMKDKHDSDEYRIHFEAHMAALEALGRMG